jgi:hypothetical protein
MTAAEVLLLKIDRFLTDDDEGRMDAAATV